MTGEKARFFGGLFISHIKKYIMYSPHVYHFSWPHTTRRRKKILCAHVHIFSDPNGASWNESRFFFYVSEHTRKSLWIFYFGAHQRKNFIFSSFNTPCFSLGLSCVQIYIYDAIKQRKKSLIIHLKTYITRDINLCIFSKKKFF